MDPLFTWNLIPKSKQMRARYILMNSWKETPFNLTHFQPQSSLILTNHYSMVSGFKHQVTEEFNLMPILLSICRC